MSKKKQTETHTAEQCVWMYCPDHKPEGIWDRTPPLMKLAAANSELKVVELNDDTWNALHRVIVMADTLGDIDPEKDASLMAGVDGALSVGSTIFVKKKQ